MLKVTDEAYDLVDLVGRLLGNIGFPIFVALYVLLRMEPTIQELAKTVETLTIVIAQINGVDVPIN